MQELDIQLICANTCQAKGCVERANKTLQDRLVKELRLRNISIIEAANNYLDQFVKEHDDRFSKAPLSDQNIHRELSAHMFLDNILCYKTLRTVSCNLTFQHNRQLFLLEDNPETRGLSKKQVSLYVQLPSPGTYFPVFISVIRNIQ